MTATVQRPPEWFAENPFARISHQRLALYRRCPAWYRHTYLEWHKSGHVAIYSGGHAVEEAFTRTIDATPGGGIPDLDVLQERATNRVLIEVEAALEREREAFLAHPNAEGEWDLDRDTHVAYATRGIAFHMEQVRACAATLGLDPVGAWVAARPWHAPLDEPQELTVTTDGRFQGEADLIYRWSGGALLVDLKASAGESLSSPEVRDQLLGYAYLLTQQDEPESIAGMEAWFLGRREPERFGAPSPEELADLGARIDDLLARSGVNRDGFGGWDAGDFFPSPSAWCDYCPARWSCSEHDATPPEGNPPSAAGVAGLVLGIADPVEKRPGKVTQRVTLVNSAGTWSFSWDVRDVERLVEQGLRVGEVVHVLGLNPWSPRGGGIELFFSSPRTALERIADRTPTSMETTQT